MCVDCNNMRADVAAMGWCVLNVNVWSREAREGAGRGLVDGAGDVRPGSSSLRWLH